MASGQSLYDGARRALSGAAQLPAAAGLSRLTRESLLQDSFTSTTGAYLDRFARFRPCIYYSLSPWSPSLPRCVPGPGVRRGPEFHRKSLGYIFTSGAIKAVGVRPFLD